MTSVSEAPRRLSGEARHRGIPPWTYDHPGMTRLEHQRILLPSWQIACHVSTIPNPGDYITFALGADNILVLRDHAGTVRAFHNVCRHRGARLLEGQGNCQSVRCPYHGWTYALDGRLRGLPVRESFPDIDLSEHGLAPVRSEIMLGFVFVCLTGDPEPLAQMWGPFLPDFAPYKMEQMVPLGPIYTEDWDVDWKVAFDNYLESYHVPAGHPGLFRMFTPDYDGMVILPSGVARGISQLREQPSPKWSEKRYHALVDAAAHLPDAERRSWRFYSMLPNLGLDIFPEQMDFFQVLPRGPGKCTIRIGVFGLPDDRREMRALRYLSARINRMIQREDEFLCQRVQQGLMSSSYRPGPLSQHEACVLQFHDLIRSRIPEALEPSPPGHW